MDRSEGGLDPWPRIRADRLQAEAVFAGGNERQRNGRFTGTAVEVLRLEPRAQTAIANLRLALPEIGLEPQLNEQVVEVQLNDVGFSGKIAAHIACAYLDSGKLAAFALGFDNHGALSKNERKSPDGMSPV